MSSDVSMDSTTDGGVGKNASGFFGGITPDATSPATSGAGSYEKTCACVLPFFHLPPMRTRASFTSSYNGRANWPLVRRTRLPSTSAAASTERAAAESIGRADMAGDSGRGLPEIPTGASRIGEASPARPRVDRRPCPPADGTRAESAAPFRARIVSASDDSLRGHRRSCAVTLPRRASAAWP